MGCYIAISEVLNLRDGLVQCHTNIKYHLKSNTRPEMYTHRNSIFIAISLCICGMLLCVCCCVAVVVDKFYVKVSRAFVSERVNKFEVLCPQ